MIKLFRKILGLCEHDWKFVRDVEFSNTLISNDLTRVTRVSRTHECSICKKTKRQDI